MRIFLDTEFTALDKTGDLISIGLAAEDGAVFYAELTHFEPAGVSDWVRDKVLVWLSGDLPAATRVAIAERTFCSGTPGDVARVLRGWLARFGGPGSVEIWADVLAYDWMHFCQLFGGAFSIPEQVFYIPFDLATLLWARGIDPDADREGLGGVNETFPGLKLARHHALYDALLEKNIFGKLVKKV